MTSHIIHDSLYLCFFGPAARPDFAPPSSSAVVDLAKAVQIRHLKKLVNMLIDRSRGLQEGPREDDLQLPVSTHQTNRRAARRKLSGEQQKVLEKQTYAPASLANKPKLLRSYALLFNEFGGSRPWTGPMSAIADALHCSERTARERVSELESAGALEVRRHPGQQSQYQLLQECTYVELPLAIVLFGSCAVCVVWAALRRTLGRGRSAVRCATAVTKLSWETIQNMTGFCRTKVAEALRWLRQEGWLSRRVVWASRCPFRRAVCRWKLYLRTPAGMRTPPRQESAQAPSGGSKDLLEPRVGPSTNSGIGYQALNAARESGAEGLELLSAFRRNLPHKPASSRPTTARAVRRDLDR